MGFGHATKSFRVCFALASLKVQLVDFFPQRNFGIGICIFLEFSLFLFRLVDTSRLAILAVRPRGLPLANLLDIIKAESTYS